MRARALTGRLFAAIPWRASKKRKIFGPHLLPLCDAGGAWHTGSRENGKQCGDPDSELSGDTSARLLGKAVFVIHARQLFSKRFELLLRPCLGFRVPVLVTSARCVTAHEFSQGVPLFHYSPPLVLLALCWHTARAAASAHLHERPHMPVYIIRRVEPRADDPERLSKHLVHAV